MIWRPILEGVATLNEIEKYWSLEDVFLANQALDVKAEAIEYHKAVAAENPHPRVRFLELPDAPAVLHSEEHLVIETPRAAEFAVGDTLHGIPRHVCPTVALYSEATVVRDLAAVAQWTITARARRITI